ncbi:TPA: hypothetical protein DCE37_16550 [Candidatus Latescibacteria bacterium]|nr:hypothetical protein [Candidatus Latescibacterota bacterium]
MGHDLVERHLVPPKKLDCLVIGAHWIDAVPADRDILPDQITDVDHQLRRAGPNINHRSFTPRHLSGLKPRLTVPGTLHHTGSSLPARQFANGLDRILLAGIDHGAVPHSFREIDAIRLHVNADRAIAHPLSRQQSRHPDGPESEHNIPVARVRSDLAGSRECRPGGARQLRTDLERNRLGKRKTVA